MRKIREVLRLKFVLDLSVRQISWYPDPRLPTICTRFAMSGLPWPLPALLTDAYFDARLLPPRPSLSDALRSVPDCAQVNHEMRLKASPCFCCGKKNTRRASPKDSSIAGSALLGMAGYIADSQVAPLKTKNEGNNAKNGVFQAKKRQILLGILKLHAKLTHVMNYSVRP